MKGRETILNAKNGGSRIWPTNSIMKLGSEWGPIAALEFHASDWPT